MDAPEDTAMSFDPRTWLEEDVDDQRHPATPPTPTPAAFRLSPPLLAAAAAATILIVGAVAAYASRATPDPIVVADAIPLP